MPSQLLHKIQFSLLSKSGLVHHASSSSRYNSQFRATHLHHAGEPRDAILVSLQFQLFFMHARVPVPAVAGETIPPTHLDASAQEKIGVPSNSNYVVFFFEFALAQQLSETIPISFKSTLITTAHRFLHDVPSRSCLILHGIEPAPARETNEKQSVFISDWGSSSS